MKRFSIIAAALMGAVGLATAPDIRRIGKPERRAMPAPRRTFGTHYPFSSARQHARHAARQYTDVVHGFPIMQTAKRGQVATERALRLGMLYVSNKGSVAELPNAERA